MTGVSAAVVESSNVHQTSSSNIKLTSETTNLPVSNMEPPATMDVVVDDESIDIRAPHPSLLSSSSMINSVVLDQIAADDDYNHQLNRDISLAFHPVTQPIVLFPSIDPNQNVNHNHNQQQPQTIQPVSSSFYNYSLLSLAKSQIRPELYQLAFDVQEQDDELEEEDVATTSWSTVTIDDPNGTAPPSELQTPTTPPLSGERKSKQPPQSAKIMVVNADPKTGARRPAQLLKTPAGTPAGLLMMKRLQQAQAGSVGSVPVCCCCIS